MLYNLGRIISNLPRQAEHADTRQAIRRHDPEQERRKKKDRAASKDTWEDDSAVVSIAALKAFLENLVERPKSDFSDVAQQSPTEYSAPEAQADDDTDARGKSPPAVPDATAYASRAYAHAAETSAQQEEQKKMRHDKNAASAAGHLSSEDLQIAHKLLKDIRFLEKEGIETLRITRNASFMDSLYQAIAFAKAQIS